MTRDEIQAIKPGIELNALVAEHVFKWRKVHGPKTDYDGPCESFDVLVPPNIEDPFPLYPPRGAIKPWWFCKDWSIDLDSAWKLATRYKSFSVARLADGVTYFCEIYAHNWRFSATGSSVEEAICKAALIAEMEVEP